MHRKAAEPMIMERSMKMNVAEEEVMEYDEIEEEELSKCFLLCIHTVLDGR